MKLWLSNYRRYFSTREFLRPFFVAVVFLAVSLCVNFYAGQYANERASNSVTDIVLSNIPVFDVDNLFIYGTLFFWLFIAYLAFERPERMPYMMKSIALFVVIRSAFITLTHLGPFPTQAVIESTNIVQKFTFGGDLFFSGHTGLPFLMALIFWRNKPLRYLFLSASFFFAAIVLMGHLHYSIDVFSAFFITYSIFCIAEKFFPKEQKMFLSGLSE